jgi:hypothetical protein
MTEARYNELVDRLLDGSISAVDAQELRQELERDPARLRDVRDNLILVEIVAQEFDPHHSAGAFWEGVRSRLNDTASPPAPAVEPRPWRGYVRPVAGLAACLLVAAGVASQWPKWKGGPQAIPPLARGAGAEVKRISLHGEVVCAHCILHQTDDCRPVVRVREADHVETIALSDNAVCRAFYRKQGCGRTPLPVLAEGVMRKENGRTLLGATRLELRH